MNENKMIKRLKSLNIVLVTLLLCVALAAIPIYAWYCYVYSSPRSVIKTGNSADVYIEQSYCIEHLKQDGTVESYEYHFVPVSITPDSKRPTGEDATTVNFDHFNFGSVINVHSLKPSNYVYLSIRIPTATGGDVDFGFSYNTKDSEGNDFPDGRFSFYSGVRNQEIINFTYLPKAENADVYAGLDLIEDTMPFIEYAYAFSDEKVESQAALESLSYVTGPNSTTKYTVSKDATLISTEHDINEENDYYYMYVRMIPNLDAFVESLDYISTYMPCLIDFNLKLTIDITHKVPTPTTTAGQ